MSKFFPPFFSFFIYATHLFILSIIFFQSHMIRHLVTQSAFKETKRVTEHSRHSEVTRGLGHSDTWGTRGLRHCRRLRRHLEHLSTECTWSLQALRALEHSMHSGIGVLGHLQAVYLADTPKSRSSSCRHLFFLISLSLSLSLSLSVPLLSLIRK